MQETGSRGASIALALCVVMGVLDGFELLALALLAHDIGRDLDIPISSFTSVFVATSIGVIAGSMVCGILADRFGRKRVLIMACLAMAAGMVGDGLSAGWLSLTCARVVTGFGIGAVLPAGTTLVSELSSPKNRRALVSVVVVSTTVGGTASAVFIPWLEHLTSWRGIFIGAGAFSALLALAMVWLLPESPTYLALHRALPVTHGKRSQVEAGPTVFEQVRAVFGERRLGTVVLLCLLFFSYYIWLGFHRSWLPLIYGSSAQGIAAGRSAAAMYGAGALAGALIAPVLALRWTDRSLMKLSLLLGSLSLFAAAATGTSNKPGFVVAYLCIGFFLTLPFQLIYGLATACFPAKVRSTGVASVTVCGRAGSLSGPVIGGALVAGGASASQTLVAFAVPVLFALASLMVLSRQVGQAGVTST